MTHRRGVTKTSARSRRRTRVEEPSLVMLLADPEVRLLMHADNVDERELRAMLKSISVHLSDSTDRKGKRRSWPMQKYRRGVGIMLINGRNEILIARRNDVPGEVWQMPQGGIDRGEAPRAAAFRELKEEIGTNEADIVAESRRWLYYDLPTDFASKAWNGRWKGQRQKWFAMFFKGQDSDINLATSHPEFDAWRWVPINELATLAISFKQQLYMSLLEEFKTIFH